MTIRSPKEFSPNYLNTLWTYVHQARRKVEGDSSFDSPATDFLKGDDWTPIDQLNISLDTIIRAINIEFTHSEQKKIQSDIYKEYLGLIDASKSNTSRAKHLTEKYESALKPKLYDVNYLNTLRKYVVDARRKIEGDKSHDSTATTRLKEDDWNPVDQLNVCIDKIVDVIHREYSGPEQQKVQFKIREEYMTLIEASKKHKPYLTEKYESALNQIKQEKNNVSHAYSNKATLNSLL